MNLEEADINNFFKVFYLIDGCYFNDARKSYLWMFHQNPMLGGVSPISMIRAGRTRKLYSFVNGCIDENMPVEFMTTKQLLSWTRKRKIK